MKKVVLWLIAFVFLGAGIVHANGKLVYISTKSGDANLWVMNDDGTDPIQLTNLPGNEIYPSWSPDGNKIAFCSNQNNPNIYEVYVMEADGSNIIQVTNVALTGGTTADKVSWYPDGQKLLYRYHKKTSPHTHQARSINLDGSNDQVVVSFAYGISLSSDAQFVVSANARIGEYWSPAHAIHLHNLLEGTDTIIYPNDGLRDFRPRFSPDNSSIAWAVDSDTNPYNWGMNIWTMNIDGSNVQNLTANYSDLQFGAACYSLNEDKIYVTGSTVDGIANLYYVKTDGTSLTQLTFDGYSSVADHFVDPNQQPVANAGANQSIHVGQTITLNGSGSYDTETPSEDLAYEWSFVSKPAESSSFLNNSNSVSSSFVADYTGDYMISLIVTDTEGASSEASYVTVSSLNTPPTANAGNDQGSYVGTTFLLDGSSSSDPDGDEISYVWFVEESPEGSNVLLSDATTQNPSFVPDLQGSYVFSLVVSDGYTHSVADSVTVAVIAAEAYSEAQSVDSLNIITTLPVENVSTPGNQTALEQTILQTLKFLQKGETEKSLLKLQSALERTDGCILRGAPDQAGGGENSPAKDYVINCNDQLSIYPLIQNAINAISP